MKLITNVLLSAFATGSRVSGHTADSKFQTNLLPR